MLTETDTRTGANKPRTSIRVRIMVFALLMIVPLMADRVRVLIATRSELIGRTVAEVADLVQRGAEAQSEMIGSTRTVLRLMAHAYEADESSGQACTALLAAFDAGVPWIGGLAVVGADDRVSCATGPLPIGLDAPERQYVQRSRITSDFVLSDEFVERSGKPGVMAAYPVRGTGGRAGATILAQVGPYWTERFAELIQQRKGASAFLMDREGRILSAFPVRGRMTAAGAPDPAALAAVSRGTLRAAGPDGLPRIYAFTDLPGTETKIVVGIEEREALGRIERTLSLAYLQLGVFGLLALLLAWFCGEHYIIAPIRTLARIAANIGRGELEHRLAPARWTVEFAPLAAALDDMALKFAERESALQAANRHLEELALVDALSGLSNRRAFERHFGHALKAAGPGVPISLLMIDVDRFKEFNDTYGHPEGDNCLRLIAKALESAMRPGDLTTRYGGEEFAVLLPGVDCAVAVEAAERCRLAVERMRIRHDAVASGFVTISIGVATRHADEPGGQQALIAAADAALYEAKRRGRNRALAWSKAMVAQAGPAPAILDKDEEKRPKQAA